MRGRMNEPDCMQQSVAAEQSRSERARQAAGCCSCCCIIWWRYRDPGRNPGLNPQGVHPCASNVTTGSQTVLGKVEKDEL